MSVLHPREDSSEALESDAYGPSQFLYKDLYGLLKASESWQSQLSTIALLDMNAFFAQVEQIRLGLSIDDPVVCVQWNMLIAVSYAARKYGIKRGDTIKAAKEKCPNVVLAHAAVFLKGDPMWSYMDKLPNQGLCKVSLDPYRRESRKIMKVLKQSCDRTEKASVDECFMDFGEQVYDELFKLFPILKKDQEPNMTLPPLPRQLPPSLHWKGFIFKNEKEFAKDNTKDGDEYDDEFEPRVTDWDDVCFIIGSKLLYRLRCEVYEKLGYTTSGGVANNKVMAKLAGGFRKPDNQTIIRRSAINNFLVNFKLTDMSGMGGKIGDHIVSKLKIPETQNSVGYIRDNFTLQSLTDILKEDPQLIQKLYNLVRGVHRLELSFRIEIKSMMSRKNFQVKYPVKTLGDAHDWLKVFVGDIISRIVELDEESMELSPNTVLPTKRRTQLRRPKTISIHINMNRKETSRQATVPLNPDLNKLSKQLESITFRLLKEFYDHNTSLHIKNGGRYLKDMDDGKTPIKDIPILSINALSIVASNFVKVNDGNVFKSVDSEDSAQENIRKMFAQLDQEGKSSLLSNESTHKQSMLLPANGQSQFIKDLFTKFNKEQQQKQPTPPPSDKEHKKPKHVQQTTSQTKPQSLDHIKDLFKKFNESQAANDNGEISSRKRKSPSPAASSVKREKKVLVLDQLVLASNRRNERKASENRPRIEQDNYCTTCGKDIADPEEHSDYHYALELSKAYNGDQTHQ